MVCETKKALGLIHSHSMVNYLALNAEYQPGHTFSVPPSTLPGPRHALKEPHCGVSSGTTVTRKHSIKPGPR